MDGTQRRKEHAEALNPRQSKPLRFGSNLTPKKKKRKKRKKPK